MMLEAAALMFFSCYLCLYPVKNANAIHASVAKAQNLCCFMFGTSCEFIYIIIYHEELEVNFCFCSRKVLFLWMLFDETC